MPYGFAARIFASVWPVLLFPLKKAQKEKELLLPSIKEKENNLNITKKANQLRPFSIQVSNAQSAYDQACEKLETVQKETACLQSAEAREQKAKTESVLENDKEKGTGENTEKIISENQKVKNEEKVDFKEKNRQKEQLYYYINHELQTLFAAYNKGEWNRLEKLGDMSSALYKEKESIIEGLPSFTGTMVKEYFSCIDFKKEEEKAVCYVKDKEQLKKAFLQFMMPFYPYYYKQLSEGGLRHTAFIVSVLFQVFKLFRKKIQNFVHFSLYIIE